MSVEDHQVSFSFEINVAKAESSIRRLETLLYRSLALIRRAGLPENIDSAISKVQRAIVVINQLRLTLLMLQAASGPVGWALAAVGMATFAFTTGDFIAELHSY